jgi:hypothetical protein
MNRLVEASMAAAMTLHELVQATVAEDHQPIGGAVRIVKERRAGNDAAFAVAFEDRRGRQRRGMVGLRQHADGSWRAAGSFIDIARTPDPHAVWSTWGGWTAGGWRDHAACGGWVADPNAASARLVDAAGRTVEDTVQNDVALFLYTGPFDLSAGRVDLVDADGEVIRSAPVRL